MSFLTMSKKTNQSVPFHIRCAIRPARAQDQATITAMVRGAHLNPMDLRWQRFLVAEDGSGIVGVGQIRPHEGASELASLVVREDRRGQGVGGQIIHALLAQLPGTVYLFCRPQLESYYAQFGFRAVSVKEAPSPLRLRYAIGRFITQLFFKRPMLMMKKTSEVP
jgi:N-acetylglutamate synthase-like GNAT family acetyltransferase